MEADLFSSLVPLLEEVAVGAWSVGLQQAG